MPQLIVSATRRAGEERDCALYHVGCLDSRKRGYSKMAFGAYVYGHDHDFYPIL